LQPAPPVPGVVLAAPPPATKAIATPPSAPNKSRQDRKAQGQARSKLADQTRPLRNELAGIEQRMAKLGAERVQHETLLASGTLAAAAIADAGRQLAHVAAEVAMLEERWLELQGQLEAMQAAAG
jgi:ATP-binding cassette, subfamily F, member 3